MQKNIVDDPNYKALKENLNNLSPERLEAFNAMIEEKAAKETPNFVTPKEFAERTGFAAGTIRRWLKEGVVKGKQVGKCSWRIPLSELEKMKVEP